MVRPSSQHRLPFFVSLFALSALAPSALSAAFVAPNSWSRSDPYSTYQQWETFTSPTGPNAPDVANTNPSSTNPNLFDSSGGSFITSGGNIYSFNLPLNVTATIPSDNLGASYVTTVLLQTRTQGTEWNYNGVQLTYNNGSGNITLSPVAQQELFRQTLGGFGGELVDYAWVFEVPDSPGLLTFSLNAATSSLSLDRFSVDTLVTRADSTSALLAGMNSSIGFVPTPIPEPATIGLLAVGVVVAVGLGRQYRRR